MVADDRPPLAETQPQAALVVARGPVPSRQVQPALHDDEAAVPTNCCGGGSTQLVARRLRLPSSC